MNIVFCLDVSQPNAQKKIKAAPYFPLYSCFTSVIESLCSNQLNASQHKFLLVNNESIISNFCHSYQHFLGSLRYSSPPSNLSEAGSIYAKILQITEKVIWISEAEKNESQFNFNKEIFPTQFLILTDGIGSCLPSIWSYDLNNIKTITMNNEWPSDVQINALLFCPFSKDHHFLNKQYLDALEEIVSITNGVFRTAENFSDLNKVACDMCSSHLSSALVALKWGQEQEEIIEGIAEDEENNERQVSSIKIHISEAYGYGIKDNSQSVIAQMCAHLERCKSETDNDKGLNWSWPKSINQNPMMRAQHMKLRIGSFPIKGIGVPKAFPKDVYSIHNYNYLLAFLKRYSAKDLFNSQQAVAVSTTKAYWQVSLESVKDQYWNSGPVGLFRIMLRGDGQPRQMIQELEKAMADLSAKLYKLQNERREDKTPLSQIQRIEEQENLIRTTLGDVLQADLLIYCPNFFQIWKLIFDIKAYKGKHFQRSNEAVIELQNKINSLTFTNVERMAIYCQDQGIPVSIKIDEETRISALPLKLRNQLQFQPLIQTLKAQHIFFLKNQEQWNLSFQIKQLPEYLKQHYLTKEKRKQNQLDKLILADNHELIEMFRKEAKVLKFDQLAPSLKERIQAEEAKEKQDPQHLIIKMGEYQEKVNAKEQLRSIYFTPQEEKEYWEVFLGNPYRRRLNKRRGEKMYQNQIEQEPSKIQPTDQKEYYVTDVQMQPSPQKEQVQEIQVKENEKVSEPPQRKLSTEEMTPLTMKFIEKLSPKEVVRICRQNNRVVGEQNMRQIDVLIDAVINWSKDVQKKLGGVKLKDFAKNLIYFASREFIRSESLQALKKFNIK